MEIWKAIPGYGGYYEASSIGRIRSVDRIVIKKTRHSHARMFQFYKGRLLKPSSNDDGHQFVHISVYKKKTNLLVHRAVLFAFIGLPEDGQECCHNNGIASDNRVENLRWDTHFNNNQDRKLHGTYPTGESHPMSKLSIEDVKKIRNGQMKQKESGVCLSHFHRIKKGESWTHLNK